VTAPLDIPALRALLETATPRPWTLAVRDGDQTWPASIGHDETSFRIAVAMCPRYGLAEFRFDAALIVAAVNGLPDLLDRLEAAEREAEEHRMEADDAASVIATSAARRRALEYEVTTLRAEVDRQQHFWEGVRDARVDAAESALADSRAALEQVMHEAESFQWADGMPAKAGRVAMQIVAEIASRALAEKGDGK